MSLTVIFARHEESQANVAGVFANRAGIPNDLTSMGISQAEALAASLSVLGIAHVYTSPLHRAAQTASIIASRLDVPMTVTDALREYDVGDYEGLPYSGSDAWRWKRYMAVEQAWRNGVKEARHPGGENLADIEARFLPFMQELAAGHPGDQSILMVSHGGFLRAVLPALLADFPREHTLGHSDRVTIVHQDGCWRRTGWIDRFTTPTRG